tara:strand:+ start:306 stop:722 length:417 start_codon:yes stop_codon:yes gene_type:complete
VIRDTRNITVLPERWGSHNIDVFKHEDTNELVLLKTSTELVSYTCESGFEIDRLDESSKYTLKPLGTFEVSHYGDHQHSYLEHARSTLGEKVHPLNYEYGFDMPLSAFLEKKGYRRDTSYITIDGSYEIVDEDKLREL